MAHNIAVIKDGVVENVIVADAAKGLSQVEIPHGQGIGIGWGWNGVSFTPTATPPTKVPEIPVSQVVDAFTQAEQLAIFASTDQDVQRALQQLTLWAAVGKPVIVGHAFQGLLGSVVAADVITQTRADEIYAKLGGV